LDEKLRLTEEAKSDIKEIASYYNEKENKELANDFLSAVQEKLIKILNRPLAYSEDIDGIRRTSIRRFPYYIYYMLLSSVVLVISVWHDKRKPGGWKERLKKIKQ